jgi:hypothetical protein
MTELKTSKLSDLLTVTLRKARDTLLKAKIKIIIFKEFF